MSGHQDQSDTRKEELVGSKKRKRNITAVRRNIVDDAFSMSFISTVAGSSVAFPGPAVEGIQEQSTCSLSESDTNAIGGKSDNDFIATYVEVGEHDVDSDDQDKLDSECFGSNDMSTSEFCSPSTSASSTCASSRPATEVDFINYPSEDNQNRLISKPDCENPSLIWANLFNSTNSISSFKLSSFSQLPPPLSYHLLLTNTVKSTVYDTSSCEDESEAQTQVFEVGVNDYKLTSNTLVRIHPLLVYNKENPCSVTPIRCFLPAKKSSKSQIYTISRNSSEPEVVQVQLEIDPTSIPFTHTLETEAKQSLGPASYSNLTVNELPGEKVNVYEAGISSEVAALPVNISSNVDAPDMSFGSYNLKSSDAFCHVTSTQSINSQSCITTSAPVQAQLLSQPQIVHYGDVSQPTTMNILHIPQQTSFSSNQIISNPTSYIIPSSLNRLPGVQAHSVCGGGQVLLTPGQQPMSFFSVRNSGVVVNQNSTSAVQENSQNSIMPSIQSSSIKLTPDNKQSTVAITSDNHKHVINGSPSVIQNNQTSAGGSVHVQNTEDLTSDKEKSRPGYVSTCHNCGTLSADFHCCSSCRRVIPRGSRILRDQHYRPQVSITNQVDPNPVVPSAKKGKAPTTRGGGGILSKRVSRKKVHQQECIVLSSDEEEGCDPSPEKKAKLSADTADDNNSSSSNHPASSDSQEIPTGTILPNSSTHGNSVSKVNVVSNAVPVSHGVVVSSTTKGDDLNRVKEEIKQIVNSGDPSAFVQVQCRSFRVGTHKVVLDSTVDTYFSADICEKGVMFNMPHVTQKCKKVHLVIPHNSILTVTCHIENSTMLFLLFRIGNKIAKWVRDTLGMSRETNIYAWFDPHMGKSSEQNIIFMMRSFNEEQFLKIKAIYRNNLNVLNSTDANQLLSTVAQPTFPSQISSNSQGNANEHNSVLLSSSNVADSSNPKSENKVSAENTTNIISTTTPGGGKLLIKNQESKAVASDKSSITNPGQDLKKPGPISRSQAEKDKVKNGKLTSALKAGTPVVNMEPISDGSRQILKWPKGQLGITLHQADLLTLRSEQFLNDQILDFWLLYVHNKLLSDVDRSRTHVFSTFFYNRLTTKPKRKSCPPWEFDKNLPQAEKRHRRVKKWTKNVDIFSKDYIIVPINDNCHWYVAIICYPGLDGPHWVDDGTPIQGWTNLALDKGKPKYNLPPGMIKRDDDKPPKKKKKKNYNRLLEDLPILGGLVSDSGAPITPKTPTKQPNGVLPAGGSNVSPVKDDMDGNAAFPGFNSPPSISASHKSQSFSGKPVDEKQVTDNPNKNQQNRAGDVLSTKLKSSEKPMLQMFENLYPDFDPYKDEAEDDPDEELLFQEYYFSDSDTTSHGSPGPGLDASSSDPQESEGAVSSNSKEKGMDEPPVTNEKSKCQNHDKLQTVAEEIQGNDSSKLDNVKVELKPEPMEVDAKQEDNSIEDKKNIRTDFRVKQPCILLFNSLSGSPRSRVFVTLREYLRLEYRERKGKERAFTKFEMPGFEPNVPQQKNMCDCGIYVLQYVEHFFAQPFPSLLLALPSSLRNWFPQLVTKRKEIYDTIVDLVKTDSPDNLRLLPAFELPSLPIPPKAEKSEAVTPAALSHNQCPAPPPVNPELSKSITDSKIPGLGKAEKNCIVSKNPKISPPPTQGSPMAKTGNKFVIPKLSATKAEKKVKPGKNDTPEIPRKLAKNDPKSETPKKSEGSKKANATKKSELIKKTEGSKKIEAARKSEISNISETLSTPTESPLNSEKTKPSINTTSAAIIPEQFERMDGTKTSLPEEIPLSAVVSAPTQKIVPVIPSEEPMDIDVQLS